MTPNIGNSYTQPNKKNRVKSYGKLHPSGLNRQQRRAAAARARKHGYTS